MRTLTLLAVLALPLAAPAAPAPDTDPEPTSAAPALDRFLPDDSHFVLSIDVKAAVSSPLLSKHLKKDAQTLLATPAVAQVLKDAGVDPLKDVDRLVMSMGNSCFPASRSDQGPVLLAVGRFNENKLRAVLADKGKTVEVGKAKVYEVQALGPGKGYVAVLGRNAVLLAPNQALIAEALDKAANKRKTRLTSKELAAALKNFKKDHAVQMVGLEEMVVGSMVSSTSDGTGKTVTTVKHTRLGEGGFKRIDLAVAVKDGLKGTLTLGVKDRMALAKMEALVKATHQQMVEAATKVAQAEPKFAPAAAAVRKVKLSTKGDGITIAAEADAEAVKSLLLAIGFTLKPVP
jgi:hypothetical protein